MALISRAVSAIYFLPELLLSAIVFDPGWTQNRAQCFLPAGEAQLKVLDLRNTVQRHERQVKFLESELLQIVPRG